MLYWVLLTTIIGLAVGSFLNVVIFRADDLQSIVNTRSKCKHCQKEIAWYDLVPLLSFALLRGKCRQCKKQLSWQYPLVELGTAITFLTLFLKFGQHWETLIYAAIFSILIVIFVYDIRTQYVLDIFSWTLVIVSFIAGIYLFRTNILNLLWGVLIGGGILGMLVLVSKEHWMGLGDVFVGAALGAIVGYPRAVLMIFLSFVLGSLFGVYLIFTKQKTIKQTLPFTPFIILASLISLLFGDKIIAWYMGAFFMY